MRRVWGGIVAAGLSIACGIALSAPVTAPAQGGQLEVGVGVEDASWHVGASAGQYAGGPEDPEPSPDDPLGNAPEFTSHEAENFDPTGHSTRRYPSYGIQSRLSVRAIVIDGPASGDSDRVAILKNDQYIPQDLVYRRAAQILEEHGTSGIAAENLTMAVTHNHSSPMYSSTSWGVWAFQDVFDIRMFEYLAQQMARAVEEAAGAVEPQPTDTQSQGLTEARVAVRSTYYDKSHRHSFGPERADDGTPAGYPQADQDHDMTVIRFDKTNGEPLANLINFSQHPEFLEGNDLISADYVAPFERMMDRETGAVTVYTQGSVGTSEPERSTYHSIHERLEFSHKDYAQAEWGARLMANAAKGAWERIGDDAPANGDKYLPYSAFGAGPQVQMADRWYPGPFSHPYPGVSNCRVDYPGVPIAGLPECVRVFPGGVQDALDALPVPAPVEDEINQFDPGVPIDTPENYSALSYAGLQEDIDVHLQAIRIGPLFLPVCSCEQWWDQSRNIELRTDKIVGNETTPATASNPAGALGYDWGALCTKNNNGTYPANDDGQGSDAGTGTWNCPNSNPPVTNHEYQVMRAQVNNPANGWNNAENAAQAEGEPEFPDEIKGNYTHDDDATSAALGYDLTVPIGMSNDYNGYIASYREYMRGDHYRKSLTGWGPHSSDYMASRLVTLGRQFNDPAYVRPLDQTQEDLAQPKVAADLALNEQRATALGQAATATLAAHEAGLPDDGGDAEPVTQPQDVERFDAAFFSWNGGSNYTDNPNVTVERRVGSNWEPYNDQSGELPVTLKFPNAASGDVPVYAQGSFEWRWTARFEAFVAGAEDQPINTGDREPATPPGTYRFVVHGQRREGGAPVDYDLTSEEFELKPWDGILPQNFKLEDDGTMSFVVGPTSVFNNPVPGCAQDTVGPVDYPDTHADPARFIVNKRTAVGDGTCDVEWFCFTCTWRPWLDFGDAETAKVTITLGNGETEIVDAQRQGNRWVTDRVLRRNEMAQVKVGNVLDPYGNTNQESLILADCRGETPPAGCAAADTDADGDLDDADNCRFVANPGQEDGDNDGVGDACETPDPDGDGDGVPDASDQCPAEAGPPSNNGCPIPPPVDTDGDGVVDPDDRCPSQAGPPSNNGCPEDPSPVDGDGDGVPDNADQCPGQPGTINNFGCPILLDAPAPPTPPSSTGSAPQGKCQVRRAGTAGRDSFLGTAGGDLLLGLGAGDQIRGGEGADCVFGGRGGDGLDGEGGEDLVRGGGGVDRTNGGEGNDVVSGGRGKDLISGGDGDDSLRAVDGDPDGVDCGPGDDSARIGPGDRARGCERVRRVRAPRQPPAG